MHVWLTKKSLNKMLEAQGQLLACELHFLYHQLGHASDAMQDWGARGRETMKESGMHGWLEFCDGPFGDQAKRRLHRRRSRAKNKGNSRNGTACSPPEQVRRSALRAQHGGLHGTGLRGRAPVISLSLLKF